jgi:hypothetical protein
MYQTFFLSKRVTDGTSYLMAGPKFNQQKATDHATLKHLN